MTEEQIIAYVDGELGPIDTLRFERAMEADPALSAEVDRHSRLRETIAGHFGPVADEALPVQLTRLLHGDDKIVAFPARRRPAMAGAARYAALAATLVAGLIVGQIFPRAATSPLDIHDGRIVARGELADALDSQLAASAPRDAAFRIGASFRRQDDSYCRIFTGASGAGLGCHGTQGWMVERFVAGGGMSGGGAYRQAASPSADILAAAQDMMAGAPLDAAQEREARDSGWAVARR